MILHLLDAWLINTIQLQCNLTILYYSHSCSPRNLQQIPLTAAGHKYSGWDFFKVQEWREGPEINVFLPRLPSPTRPHRCGGAHSAADCNGKHQFSSFPLRAHVIYYIYSTLISVTEMFLEERERRGGSCSKILPFT